jgi:hypothetical protein
MTQLTIFEDRARVVPLIHFLAKEDGSITMMLREPMNQLHFLPTEVNMIKAFLGSL